MSVHYVARKPHTYLWSPRKRRAVLSRAVAHVQRNEPLRSKENPMKELWCKYHDEIVTEIRECYPNMSEEEAARQAAPYADLRVAGDLARQADAARMRRYP